jgi:hypothetical protein
MEKREGEDAEEPGERGDGPQPLNARKALYLMRGFSWVFWGLPLTLLLFFGAVEVHVLAKLRLPSYALGVLVLFTGFLNVTRAGPITPAWHGWARSGVLLSFIMLYLTPFVYWWDRAPHVRFFGANMWILLVSTMLILVVVNRLASELGLRRADTTFAIEARLCAWSVVVLMMLPFGIAIGYAYYAFKKYGVTVPTTLSMAHKEMPFWLHVFFLLPFTLTMTTVWKARERALHCMVEQGQRAESSDP